MSYKVIQVPGGWDVFWVEPDAEPRLIPHVNERGEVVPYPHRQSAYRRSKQLNDLSEKLDQQIERDGGAIIL